MATQTDLPSAPQLAASAPSVLSWAFHVQFFPALLKQRFRLHQTKQNGFVPSGYLEGMLTVLVSSGLIVGGGARRDPTDGLGITLLALGGAGLLYSLYRSIADARELRPSYENFLFGLFFFSIMLGVFVGLVFAVYHPAAVRAGAAGGGALAGYWVGLILGVQAQRLGFIGGALNQFAMLGALGLIVVAILLGSGA